MKIIEKFDSLLHTRIIIHFIVNHYAEKLILSNIAIYIYNK